MNDPLLAEPTPRGALQRLLDAHFSEASLSALLGPEAAALGRELWSRALGGPALEFVERTGKAFRADLAQRCFELAGGRGRCPEVFSAIVEILHAGSLIIDDIEDQSATRRGGPALHIVHGVPVALNVGNWMYFWALGLIEGLDVEPEVQLRCHQWAVRTLLRCHHGQSLDLTANVYQLPQHDVPRVVLAGAELKTGALLELSAVFGGVAAGAPAERVRELGCFGRRMGVALQMLDDVGGLVSEKRCQKGHEDLRLGRATWPWAWLSAELTRGQYTELQQLGREVEALDRHPELLAQRLRAELRGSGRVRVRRYIHTAFAELQTLIGPTPGLAQLRADLQRLEKSYG
jgi:geranylgeranyl pyrophosphate synthase